MDKSTIQEILLSTLSHDYMEVGEERVLELIDYIEEGHTVETLFEEKIGGRKFDLQVSFELLVEALTAIKLLYQIYREYQKGEMEEKEYEQKIEEILSKRTKRLSHQEKKKLLEEIKKL
jgi:hypothetical protein